MNIRRRVGTDEIEISGTEAQCLKAMDAFIAGNQNTWEAKWNAIAGTIRNKAAEKKLDKPNDRPLIELLKELLG